MPFTSRLRSVAAVPPQASLTKFTVTVCAPLPQVPFSVTVSDWFSACSALAVKVPPTCTPSTLTVYWASPFQASSLIRSTSVSGPVPAVRLTGWLVDVVVTGAVTVVVAPIGPETWMITGWSVTSTLTELTLVKVRMGEVPSSGSKISIFWKVWAKLIFWLVGATLIAWLVASFQMSGSAQVMICQVPLLFCDSRVWPVVGALVTVKFSVCVAKVSAVPPMSARMVVRLWMAVAAGLGDLSSRNRPKYSSWLVPA